MDGNDVLHAMEERIQEKYPGEPVYWDQLPKDFVRPSFTLELQKTETADVNIALVQRTVEVLITCYVEIDAYGDSSQEALNQRQGRMMDLFSSPLQVGDRWITASVEKGVGAPDQSEVTVTFRWMDGRAGYVDEDTAAESESGVPLMMDFEIKMDQKPAHPPILRNRELRPL